VAIGWILAIAFLLLLGLSHFAIERALGALAGFLVTVIAALLALLAISVLRHGRLQLWWGLLLSASAIAFVYGGLMAPPGLLGTLAAVWLGGALLGGGLARLRGSVGHQLAAIAGAVLLLAVAVLFLIPGFDDPLERELVPADVPQLQLADPGARGTLHFSTFTYGSGTDRNRPEFGTGARLRTASVDGAKLIDGWSGLAGWARTRYWGFDAKALPIQGRVWMPTGDGPYPLALIVHGNHDMEDFSDTGYGYLGELFASHGVITVSVDENFLNSSLADLLGGFDGGLEKENDARGWLLLEHLRQFREWNATADNPFTAKVDLDRVVLVGHSRGGEAVAEAALFNRLSFYPDDATLAFDYGFGIRGLIAIAPADGQYDPRDLPTELVDISYFVIHGSHDGDVQSFMGAPQYMRTTFVLCDSCFKAGWYVVGANHGQFNTSWGRHDFPPPWDWVLNLTPIMDGEAQRRIARASFGAFLQVVLDGRNEYRSFLAEPDAGRDWIGGTEVVHQFVDARRLVIADYEEDADVSTATLGGARIVTKGLSRWRERLVPLKWDDLDSAAAQIGWNGPESEYRIEFDSSPAPIEHVEFALAMSDANPSSDAGAEGNWQVPDVIDFSIVFTDVDGQSASVPLSSVHTLNKPVAVTTRKWEWFDDIDASEPVFQYYRLPAGKFESVDMARLASLALRFDRTAAGTIWLDELAFEMRPTEHSQ